MDVPEVMAAVLLTGHGGLDKLVYRTDVPVPRPGPGEILVRVAACGLNNTDVNTRIGWYASEVRAAVTAELGAAGVAGSVAGPASEAESRPPEVSGPVLTEGSTNRVGLETQASPVRRSSSTDGELIGGWGGALPFPLIQGADVCGYVADVGAGLDRLSVGRRVMIDPWLLAPADPDHVGGRSAQLSAARYLGSEVDGGFAEYCVAPAANVHVVESLLTDVELATFPCAYTTAENLLTKAAVAAGDVVVVTGASGGVGTAVLQIARLRDAHVIAIAASAKADAVRELGAAAVVDRSDAAVGAAVRAVAPGGCVDAVIDVVGASMFEQLIPLLRPGGRYATAGAIGGPIVELDLRHLIYGDLQFNGATVCPAGTFARVITMIESGALRPMLAATYPLAELRTAQEAFLAKRHVGNIVVTIGRPTVGG